MSFDVVHEAIAVHVFEKATDTDSTLPASEERPNMDRSVELVSPVQHTFQLEVDDNSSRYSETTTARSCSTQS